MSLSRWGSRPGEVRTCQCSLSNIKAQILNQQVCGGASPRFCTSRISWGASVAGADPTVSSEAPA